MTSTADRTEPAGVPGVLHYLDPSSPLLRRFTAPGHSVNTAAYEAHEVPIRSGRGRESEFSLEVQGFEIVNRPTAVTDFRDDAQLREVYLREVSAFTRERTGADWVVTRGFIRRRAADPKANASQPAAALIHIDYDTEGQQQRAEQVYAEAVPDGPGFSRVQASSFWRCFTPPPQDWPLALCDNRSVRDDEGSPNELYFVEEVPDDLAAPMERTPDVNGTEMAYSPDHEWWYFPDMVLDEALFFVFNDTDRSHAWRVVHTAFHDETAHATEPRHSVEVRSFAFWR